MPDLSVLRSGICDTSQHNGRGETDISSLSNGRVPEISRTPTGSTSFNFLEPGEVYDSSSPKTKHSESKKKRQLPPVPDLIPISALGSLPLGLWQLASFRYRNNETICDDDVLDLSQKKRNSELDDQTNLDDENESDTHKYVSIFCFTIMIILVI